MSATSLICPKCQGTMSQGFIADFADMGQNANVSTWVEGPPQASLLFGTETPGDKRIPVGTYRCSACGYLEVAGRGRWAAGGRTRIARGRMARRGARPEMCLTHPRAHRQSKNRHHPGGSP